MRLLRDAADLRKFQFTRPQGARQRAAHKAAVEAKVSIHAPARGATPPRPVRQRHEPFQFTRPQGARRRPQGALVGGVVSIHAPARGATIGVGRVFKGRGVSIHAPARGATGRHRQAPLRERVSIHAPARGATSSGCRARRQRGGFNSRARKGRDGPYMPQSPFSLFQFTRPQGARHQATAIGVEDEVSIHAPARGATTNPTT